MGFDNIGRNRSIPVDAHVMSIHNLILCIDTTSRKSKILFSFDISLTCAHRILIFCQSFLLDSSRILIQNPKEILERLVFAVTALIPVWWEMLTFSSYSSHFISWHLVGTFEKQINMRVLDEFILRHFVSNLPNPNSNKRPNRQGKVVDFKKTHLCIQLEEIGGRYPFGNYDEVLDPSRTSCYQRPNECVPNWQWFQVPLLHDKWIGIPQKV